MRIAWLLLLPVAFSQGWPSVRWEPFISGLSSPVDIQSPHDGSGRLFVLEQVGRIRLIRNGALVTAPVLDIAARVQFGGEMGLLGLAFPPEFVTKQYFYVNYVDRQRRTIVSRFKINGDVADPSSEEILLAVPQPFTNHNGGQIVFGPRDGYLYIGMGDGGSAGDPQRHGQNPTSLLGKMLRLDTERSSRPTPEIWALGLRNPWRFSFDRETADLYIADVGQGAKEEIDFQPADSAGGENYGWNLMEGTNCYNNSNCTNRADLVRPIFEYGRGDGVSVTGGFVYRGARYPFLQGVYICGDFGNGNIFGVRRAGDGWESTKFANAGSQVSTFGEDEAGEILMADYMRGTIRRLAADPPPLAISAIVSGADFTAAGAPGAIMSLFANAIPGIDGVTAAARYPLPTTLSGVSVRVNGTAAPLYAVTPRQINFQLPWDASGDVSIAVSAGAITAPVFRLRTGQAAPALFAVAQRGVNSSIISASNPALRGETIILYASGLGTVSNAPPVGAAALASPLSMVLGNTEVSIGGRSARIDFAGLAPGFAGLYQINVVVPADAAPGESEVVLRTGGVGSAAFRINVR